jgi:hypothetical protein
MKAALAGDGELNSRLAVGLTAAKYQFFLLNTASVYTSLMKAALAGDGELNSRLAVSLTAAKYQFFLLKTVCL